MNNIIKRVDFLDYFRGIAVLAVFLLHCLGTTFGSDALPWNGWIRCVAVGRYIVPDSFLMFLPTAWGWAGVPIFFVVSGFCIHMSFHQQDKQWGSFFIRRFWRIYPPFLAAVLFCELLKKQAVLSGTDGVMQWVTHLLLVHNFTFATFKGINPVFWSIAIEFQLYLIYPLLLALVTRMGWKKTLMAVGTIELVMHSIKGLFSVTDYGKNSFGYVFGILDMTPLSYWLSWSIGAYLADALIKGNPIPLGKVSPWLWLMLALEASLIKPLDPFAFLLFSLATAAAISRILETKFPKVRVPAGILAALKQVGIWSYSIYLLHVPLLRIFVRSVCVFFDTIYDYPVILFMVCVAIGFPVVMVGGLWHKFIELPSIARGKKIIKNRSA